MSFYQILIIELLKSIPIIIIGLITGYIAWRQYVIEKGRYDKELYSIRLKIYQAIDDFIRDTDMFRTPDTLPENVIQKLFRDTSEMHFVFPKKMSEKFDNIIRNYIIKTFGFLNDSEVSKDQQRNFLVDRYKNLWDETKKILDEMKIEMRLNK